MQIDIDFEAGLTERYPTLLDAVRAQVRLSGKPLKAIASDLGISQSDLSRKLAGNPDDPRRFSTEDLKRLMPATGGVLVIHWLIERFLETPDSRRDRALAELREKAPQLIALLQVALKDSR